MVDVDVYTHGYFSVRGYFSVIRTQINTEQARLGEGIWILRIVGECTCVMRVVDVFYHM